MREIATLQALRHPNVVNLITMFCHKDRICLVFDYVEKTVLQMIDAYPHGLSRRDVKSLRIQMLQVVSHMHSNNVLHRDFKPENLLVSEYGVLKLCDFGFARQMGKAHSVYTDYVST